MPHMALNSRGYDAGYGIELLLHALVLSLMASNLCDIFMRVMCRWFASGSMSILPCIPYGIMNVDLAGIGLTERVYPEFVGNE